MYMLFGDPAVNLFVQPTSGIITSNTMWTGRIDIVDDVTVAQGANLLIVPEAVIIFHQGASLFVEGTIQANSPSGITFKSGMSQGGGVRLSNLTNQASVIKNCDFEGLLYGIALTSTPTLTNDIEGNTFTACDYGIYAYNTENDICDNEFDECVEAAIKLEVYEGEVSENEITLGEDAYGIWACSSPDVDYIKNIITGEADDSSIGIYLQYGTGMSFDSNVVNVAGECDMDFYHCGPIMHKNILRNGGGFGMRLANSAQSLMDTNRIADNADAEIYIEGYKFPFMEEGHNDIIDEDDPETPVNPGEFLIEAYYESIPGGGYTTNQDYNWWYANGETLDENEARAHIYPEDDPGDFEVEITEVDNQSNTGYSPQGFTTPTLEELFLEAVALQSSGDYQSAYNAFLSLINNNPNEFIAVTAGNHLFSCAVILEMDMSVIAGYFNNLAVNALYDDFEKSWRDLVSYCNVEDGNYEDAIAYYESIIDDTSSSLADSVYAVIDAGEAYLRAELAGVRLVSGSGELLFGSIKELCPANHREYEATVKRLLNQLSSRNYGGDKPTIVIPESYALHQNYPNPFNPVTNIKFDIPELSSVKLEVFNILGQRVITLVDGLEEAGYKKVVWDGQSSAGVPISSGIYIYRLRTTGKATGESFTKCRKMLLLK